MKLVEPMAPHPPRRPASDADSMQRIAEGDLDALGILYDAYAALLLVFTTRLVGAVEAEDIVQTAFLRVLRIAKTFDGDAINARPWLFGIAARIVQERNRSLRRWAAALLKGQHTAERAQLPPVEARWDLDRGLANLSPSKRCVLLLSDVEGFSCPEIASMLAIPIGTVWTRLHHARLELRAFWKGVDW